jgi:hypothetical protein
MLSRTPSPEDRLAQPSCSEARPLARAGKDGPKGREKGTGKGAVKDSRKGSVKDRLKGALKDGVKDSLKGLLKD